MTKDLLVFNKDCGDDKNIYIQNQQPLRYLTVPILFKKKNKVVTKCGI